jgi:ribose transport system ATP-binding protein
VPPTSGRLSIDGASVDLRRLDVRRAISLGLILVPADRQGAALVDGLTVAENLALPVLGRTLPGWFVTDGAMSALSEPLVERFDVRPADPAMTVRALSGGNQQKVVLAKWLQTSPRLILLDEPTQGVDVGARQQVFGIIKQAAARGACVLCASSDHEQLADICDRVLVFSRGRVVADLAGREITKQTISERCYDSLGGLMAARPEAQAHG